MNICKIIEKEKCKSWDRCVSSIILRNVNEWIKERHNIHIVLLVFQSWFVYRGKREDQILCSVSFKEKSNVYWISFFI
jgi:hypothetical protein